MNHSIGRSDAPLRTELRDYYLWEEPEREVRIYLNPSLVDRMQLEVALGFRGGSPEAAEVGGILLGTADGSHERTVVVEDFRPVPRERRGAGYVLSGKDRATFDRVLEECRKAEGGLRVVGYYRSHLRNDLFLSAEDLALIRDCFQDPAQVFLLIKPFGNGSCTAGFFLWEEGRIQSDFCSAEIPFGMSANPLRAPAPHASAAKGPVAVAGAAAAEPARAPTAQRAASAERRLRPRLRAPVLLLVAGVLAFAVLLGLLVPRMLRHTPAPVQRTVIVPGGLGLQIEKKPDHLLLSWNRNSAEVQSAQGATLFIRDGDQQREFDIDLAQLRTGRVFYSAASADVQFRLEVFLDGSRSVAESIRVLAPDALSADSLKRSPAVRTVIAEPRARPSAHTGEAARPAVSHANPTFEEPVSDSGPEPREAVKKFSGLPVAQNRPAQPDALGLPPALQATRPVPDAGISPAVTVPSPPPAASQPPAKVQPVRTDYTGPRIIHRATPILPSIWKTMNPRLTEEQVVSVTVHIDENGKVTEATVLPGQNSNRAVLAAAARSAARLFRFEPALKNGQKIASDMVLTFRFLP